MENGALQAGMDTRGKGLPGERLCKICLMDAISEKTRKRFCLIKDAVDFSHGTKDAVSGSADGGTGVLVKEGDSCRGRVNILKTFPIGSIAQNGETYGSEALRMAVYHGDLEMVKYLYEKGADLTANGQEALRASVYFGDEEMAGYLRGNTK